jgi:AcrR family transcriptional regulator
VYDVNMPYHHGHLREALVDAALATARRDGPDAVVLRAATRAVAVSPSAAYRHFADRDELLSAVAQRCMSHLADVIESRLAEAPGGSDPVATAWGRLRAAGRAYVEFALSEPGWFGTAFGAPAGPPVPSAVAPGSPFQLLNELLDDLVATGALPPEKRPGAEYAAWAAVHGIATLLVDGPLRHVPPAGRDQIVTGVIDNVVAGLSKGLGVPDG